MIVKRICILALALFFLVSLITGCNQEKTVPTEKIHAEKMNVPVKPEKINAENTDAQDVNSVNVNDKEVNIETVSEQAQPTPNLDNFLINAERLKKLLGQENLTIIDVRPREQYTKSHIPGAIWFNIKALSDPNRRGRFTSPKLFSLSIREYGVNDTDRIVIYGDEYNHARLWLFLNMYDLNVQILDGGFKQWEASGYETATGREKRNYLGKFKITEEQLKKPANIETIDVYTALNKPESNVIIDARSVEEYNNKGHIPGAINITWNQLVNTDMTFKNTSDLKELFSLKGVTQDKQVIIYSNNAARAAYVYFALKVLLGYENVKVYDGYFIYWAAHRPLEKGSS